MLRKFLLRASIRRNFTASSLSSLVFLGKCFSSSSSQIPNSHFVEHLEDSAESPPSATISIDRTALYNPTEHSHEPSAEYELVKHLKNIIKFRGGPITVAVYMEEVLTNPKAGYYINRDVFGADGDFITSPEVSQMFGEVLFCFISKPTPATLYLMIHCKWAETEEIARLNHNEVCLEAIDLTQEISKRIAIYGGRALIIDYGVNGIVSNSVQAIRKHKFVDILDNLGSADLSAYVDFAEIRHSAEEVPGVDVHGPMTVSQFFGSLGINFQVEALLDNCTKEQAESLRTGYSYWRLVGEGEVPFWEGPDDQTPIGMGTRYLAMAITNQK